MQHNIKYIDSIYIYQLIEITLKNKKSIALKTDTIKT